MTEREKIIQMIKLLGIKKSHVAHRCGLSNSELSHYLVGRRELSPDKIEKIRNYLKV
jgi:transcriptional regulator with XRE-family HTH domain